MVLVFRILTPDSFCLFWESHESVSTFRLIAKYHRSHVLYKIFCQLYCLLLLWDWSGMSLQFLFLSFFLLSISYLKFHLLSYKMCFRVVGMVALQKFIVSLGGIGTSSVGSSSTYAPKELNKEVVPEKVNILGCILTNTILSIFFFFDKHDLKHITCQNCTLCIS